MFLLAALVSLVVPPSPWNALGFVVCLALFGGEVVFWHRTVRERRAKGGAETWSDRQRLSWLHAALKGRCVSRASSTVVRSRRRSSTHSSRRHWRNAVAH